MNSSKNIKEQLSILKIELEQFDNEISTINKELSSLKEDFGYSTLEKDTTYIKIFSEIKSRILIDNNPTNIKEQELVLENNQTSSEETTTDVKALTIIKSQSLLNLGESTKKVAKFSLKSFFISLVISFINLFI